jgi:hypothetical protein
MKHLNVSKFVLPSASSARLLLPIDRLDNAVFFEPLPGETLPLNQRSALPAPPRLS